jgi:Isopropylmalate/homocitrate/citramalate synthases
MIRDSVLYAKQQSLSVRYTIEDASRTSTQDLLDAYECAVSSGADRICFADTVGIMEPQEIADRVKVVRQKFVGIPLELHLHDDRGLAMANSLAGIASGANWISTSVNGIGERSGITDLCTLLANLEFKNIRSLKTSKTSLLELSHLVQIFTGCGHDEHRPVTGRHSFTHSAKLHVNAVQRREMSYSWMDPATIGAKTAFANQKLQATEQAFPAAKSRAVY